MVKNYGGEVYASFATYAQARTLIPVFEYYATQGDFKEIRQDARAILEELRGVRDVDYSPGRRGAQIFFSNERQLDFYNRVFDEIILREV
jgi:hypothetical protein